MTKDKKPPVTPDSDKSYLVETPVDTSLSKTEEYYLRMKKKPKDKHGRQDALTDRRDTCREQNYLGDERRKSEKDRRDS